MNTILTIVNSRREPDYVGNSLSVKYPDVPAQYWGLEQVKAVVVGGGVSLIIRDYNGVYVLDTTPYYQLLNGNNNNKPFSAPSDLRIFAERFINGDDSASDADAPEQLLTQTWDLSTGSKNRWYQMTGDDNLFTESAKEGREWVLEVLPKLGINKIFINGNPITVSDSKPTIIDLLKLHSGLVFSLRPTVKTGKPVILVQPQGATGPEGTTVKIETKADNYDRAEMLYNNKIVPGAIGTAISFELQNEVNDGSYQWRFYNGDEFIDTDAAFANISVEGAPLIVVQPAPQTIEQGEDLTLSVIANGNVYAYQWYKNNAQINGANGSTYTKQNALPTDSGSYRVVVININGSTQSNSVDVTVNALVIAPTITTQPTGQTVAFGSAIALAVSASGSNLSYEWSKDNGSIPGATLSTYTKENASSADAGSYRVRVYNTAGSVLSAAASVAVGAAPKAVITFTQPTGMTVGDPDQPITVTSTNDVTPIVLTSSNTNIATIVNGSLHIVAPGTVQITASQVAGNGFTAATPVVYPVVMAAKAAIIDFTQPTNMTVGDADQTLVASSNNTVTPIVFSTSDTSKATIVNGKLHVVAAGTFSVYADQAAGNGFLAATRVTRSISVFSAVAPTKVLIRISGDSFVRNIGGTGVGSSGSGSGPGIMSITNQIKARLAQQAGTNVQFTVTDDGGFPGQTASWFATNQQNVLTNVKNYISGQLANYDRVIFIPIYGTNDSGDGGVNDSTFVDAIVSNLNNANTQIKALSNKVQVVAYPITSRKDANVQPGTSAFRNAYNSRIINNPTIVNANATGNYPLYSEIYSENAADDSRYFKLNDADGLSKIHPTDLGYYRISEMLSQQIANLCSIVLTADGDPIIYQHPASQNLAAGQSLSLSVIAMGLSLAYQWKKGTANISGATAPNYSKSSAVSNDSASYSVVVSNSVRSITSNLAVVEVEAPPSVSLLASLPTGLSYLAAITADGSGVNEVSTQGNFTAFAGRSTPAKVNNSINGKAAYKFTAANPDGFKLSLTNVQSTIMVAVTVRIDSYNSGIGSAILSLPFNQTTFLLSNNYPDGRLVGGVQNQEIGGAGINAGLPKSQLATVVFFTDSGAPKMRFKGTTYTASGAGNFSTLLSTLDDFLVGGKTDPDYPSTFDGIMGGIVIANGDVTEAKAIQVETAMNNYYGI